MRIKKIEIDTNAELLVLDGVKISFWALSFIVHPDPTRWYKFERADDQVIVHTRPE